MTTKIDKNVSNLWTPNIPNCANHHYKYLDVKCWDDGGGHSNANIVLYASKQSTSH